jgi:hypothetical protein
VTTGRDKEPQHMAGQQMLERRHEAVAGL